MATPARSVPAPPSAPEVPGPTTGLPLLVEPRRALAGSESGIHLRILIPFTALLVFVLGAFLVATYLVERKERERDLAERTATAQRLFRHELEEDASLMHGTLEAVIRNKELAADMRRSDTGAILSRMGPLFRDLERDHGVTHFSFMRPDRRVVARLHEPSRNGDEVGRATVRRAERTGRIATGIELGRAGSFTLRAVVPWREGGALIGFVELGHEVREFIQEVHEIVGMDVLVLVYKKYLTALGWTGPRRPGGRWPWDALRTTAVVAASTDRVPRPVLDLMEEEHHPYEALLAVEEEDRSLYVAFVPLRDAADREVGDLVVLRDVTDEEVGFRRTMLATAGVSVLAAGAVFGLFVVTLNRVERDYRRKREVEAQVTRLTAEHERIVQVEKLSAIGTMISEVAHQINNPLVGVVNMAQLAQRDVGDPARTRRRLDDIIAAGKHCHAFVKRMVEFTRLARSEREPTDLRQIIDDTASLFRNSARGSPAVVVEMPGPPVVVSVDPIMIRHALFNLLSNAAQAQEAGPAPAAGATIAVRVVARRRAEDGREGWDIEVQDRGPGLRGEVPAEMFTPFFTTRAEGTGLGLPVVQYVANLHGGSIEGANRDGGGAVFRLWLPARDEEVSP